MTARIANLTLTALLLGNFALAQQTAPATTQTAAPTTSAANSQAVANSGLLPIYGVELNVDKTWIDGASFPSQSTDFPNAGVNASFQQVWDALKPAGFNFVRVGVDVYDSPGSANRAANVCSWAQRNNVKVVLVMRGTGSQGNGDYASSATAFVKALAGLLKQDAYKASYAQIAAFELAPALNNPSSLQKISPNAKAPDLLTQTAQSVRSAETNALKGSGIDATPLIVSASFDYELISAKAIAGTTLTDEGYNAAYSSLLQWLKPLAASPNIDLIAVDWFPGSVSTGGVDKPPVLLRSIATDLPGKQFLFITGFSTAFHTEDEQKQYYTMTFANLGDLRASGGASSPFVGVIYRGAMNAKPPAVPDSSLPQAVGKWDWPSKAAELASMWTDQKKSDEMNWWLESVQDNMGLLHAQADAFDAASLKPKASVLTLGQISSAVSASASSPTNQTAGSVAGGAAVPGQPMSGMAPVPGQGASGSLTSTIGQTLQAKATQGLSGLLDNVMQKVMTMEQSSLNGGGGGFSGMPLAGNGSGSGAAFPQPGGANPVSAPCPVTDPASMPASPAPCNSLANPPGSAATGVGMPISPNQSLPAAGAGNLPSADGSAGAGTLVPAAPMGLPPGSITLAKQDISIQPANPTVGQPVQITANLHNQSSSPAAGVTVLASGAKNVVLSEADSIQLPANSAYAASLQWIPRDASPTLITLRVSDGTGAQMASVALDPVNVAAVSGAGDSTVRSPIGSSTTGATAGKIANGNPGEGTTGASAGGVDNNTDSSTALVPLGFAKIGDIEAQNLVAGTPGSIMVPISDPLLVPLTNIKAVLTLDGKVVQTQTAPMLLSQQSRSIVFSNLIITQPGTHQARVGVQLMRGGKSQLGAVSQNIFVAASVGNGPVNAALNSAKSVSHLRSLTPTLATGSTTTVANAAPGAASAGAAAGKTAAASQSSLTLTLRASDLSYSPAPASPGQPVTFRIVVRNPSGVAVQRAALVLSLYADGRVVAASQSPIQFSVAANSSYQASWQAVMPAAREVQFMASVTGEGTPASDSGKASILLQSAPTIVPKGTSAVKPGATKRP